MLFTLISRLAPNFTNPNFNFSNLKFIYSEKATKFCEIFSYILTVCTVAFSEYVNFKVFQSLFFLILRVIFRVEESPSWHGKTTGKSVTFFHSSNQIFIHSAFYFGIVGKKCAFNNKN